MLIFNFKSFSHLPGAVLLFHDLQTIKRKKSYNSQCKQDCINFAFKNYRVGSSVLLGEKQTGKWPWGLGALTRPWPQRSRSQWELTRETQALPQESSGISRRRSPQYLRWSIFKLLEPFHHKKEYFHRPDDSWIFCLHICMCIHGLIYKNICMYVWCTELIYVCICLN